jgi:NADH:ubiquinone oxidoreductase subunit 3 (subunit A)
MAEYVGVLILLVLVGVPACLCLAFEGRASPAASREAGETEDSAESSTVVGFGFFLAAVAFVVLQGVGLLLVAWALAFGGLGPAGLAHAIFFLLPLVVGFAYLWRQGALGR